MQNKITLCQKEKEWKISQQEEELNALKNETCTFRDQNKDLNAVLKRLQMECEMLKRALNVAHQLKAEFKEKAQKLRNEVEMFEKRGILHA